LRRNCLLKHLIEEKIREKIRGGRRYKLLMTLREKKILKLERRNI
jgi:hypothetical protein